MATTSTTRSTSAAAKKNSAAQDAVQLLTKDHREVKTLFKKYEKLVAADAPPEERQELARLICTMLTVHATIEEEIFYPAAREALSEVDLLNEAEVEHASAKDLIAQILSMDPLDLLYDAKVTVLGEYIDHHVQEEENEMFPKAQKAGMNLEALGTELMARKSELIG